MKSNVRRTVKEDEKRFDMLEITVAGTLFLLLLMQIFFVNILCDFIRVCEKRVKGLYEGTKESSKNATGIL